MKWMDEIWCQHNLCEIIYINAMFSENEWLTIETKKLNKLNQFFWIGANENNKENSDV